jgi:hypothetical protein
MSEDSFTEVTSESWGSRIGNSIKGIVFGLILFVVAFPVLFMNEGRAVKTSKALKEGAGAVLSLPSVDQVDPSFEGKLVHAQGQLATVDTLSDPVFGVSQQAIKLERTVEMFQWQEKTERQTKKKLGGGTETVTTYTYVKNWSPTLVNSADFKRQEGRLNPSAMPWKKQVWQASKVTLGGYELPAFLVQQVKGGSEIPVTQEMAENLNFGDKPVAAAGNAFYVGYDPAQPEVGDVRIKFQVTRPGQVSLVAVQQGDSFTSYKASNGRSIGMLSMGTKGAAEMFTAAQSKNKVMTWFLRVLGFVLMMAGLNMVLKPISVFADVLPFLGNLLEAGLGLISGMMAAALSLVTISIAWIAYRPLVGIPLLMVAAAILFKVIAKRKTGTPAGAVPDPAS